MCGRKPSRFGQGKSIVKPNHKVIPPLHMCGNLCVFLVNFTQNARPLPMKNTVACDIYPWFQLYNEDMGKNIDEHLDEILAQVAAAGVSAWEQPIKSEAQARGLQTLLRKHRLSLASIYVDGNFHDAIWEKAVAAGVQQAAWARELGARIVVCNPSPINWSTQENKSDSQLRTQARALEAFGAQLDKLGMRLAYHTHDAEMRAAARELHHMLAATDPALVGFCLDTHWIYRGSGNSELAIDDIVTLYGKRIVALHLRQSTNQVWSEVFGGGDIDHARIAKRMRAFDFTGPLIIEQTREAGTPSTMPAGEALRRGCEAVRKYFGDETR